MSENREDFDPGVVEVDDFLTEEQEAAILREVGEELLIEEDQSIVPPADVNFITEEQESEIILQIAAWVDTFMFGGVKQSAARLEDPHERANGRTGLAAPRTRDGQNG